LAIVDLTTWGEVDPSSNLTVTSSSIVADDLQRQTSAGLWKAYDSGNYPWDGDFTFKMKITLPANGDVGASWWLYPLLLSDATGFADGSTHESSNQECTGFLFIDSSGSARLPIFKTENGVRTTVYPTNLSWSTTYYITFERDDDGGANSTGRMTLRIYTVNYYGESGAIEHDTVTVDFSAGIQPDFDTLQLMTPRGDAGQTQTGDFTIEDFDDGLAGAVYVDMVGSSAGQSSTAASLSGPVWMVGTSAGQSTASGNMGIAISLVGTSAGQSSTSAFLSSGPPTGAKLSNVKTRIVAFSNDVLYYEDV